MHKSCNSNAKLARLFWEIRGVYAKITPCAPMRRLSHMIPFRDRHGVILVCRNRGFLAICP